MLFLYKKRKSIGPAQRPRLLGLENIQSSGRQDAGPYKPDPSPEEDQRRAIRESPLQEDLSPAKIHTGGPGKPGPYGE